MTDKEAGLQIQNLGAIQEIANVYQQVAAIRMRRIKDVVIQNRSFYESLSQVYLETERIYLKTYKEVYKQSSNGKSVAVLMTANTGLYGSVIKNVLDLFTKDHAESGADLVVVGRLGRNWIQALRLKKPFKYFDLPDGTDNIDLGIKQIFDYVSKYANLSVYHGIFKNIVEQPAQVTEVTQKMEPLKGDVEQKLDKAATTSFLFEPSIDKVLQRFEEQLVYAFFDQSVYESALAKFGSRMMSLDTANQNISKALLSMRMSAVKIKHKKQNSKQMEQISGTVLWKTVI